MNYSFNCWVESVGQEIVNQFKSFNFRNRIDGGNLSLNHFA